MEKYYIVIDKSQQGPFTIEELKEKDITQITLVWTEKMESWVEAKNVEELKDIIKKCPPPIPQLSGKQLKQKLITQTLKVSIAKQIKSVFIFLLYGLIIGAISFPIFYFGIYKVNKYNNYDNSSIIEDNFNDYLQGLSVHLEAISQKPVYDSINKDTNLKVVKNDSIKRSNFAYNNKYTELPNQKYQSPYIHIGTEKELKDLNTQHLTEFTDLNYEKYRIYKKKSAYMALYTFLIVTCVLIVIKYILKGVKWVKTTSNKEI